MEVPKRFQKYWWLPLVAVPIVVALIGVVPPIFRGGGGGGDSFYVGDVQFNSYTQVVEEVSRAMPGGLSPQALDSLRTALNLIRQRSFDAAIPTLEALVQQVPVPSLFANIGAAHLANGDEDAALVNFARAPGNEAAESNISRLPPRVIDEVRVVAVSSNSTRSWTLVDGGTNYIWASDDGNLPQTLVVELPATFLISEIVFDHTASGDGEADARELEVYVSTLSEGSGYERVAIAALRRGEITQGVRLAAPTPARWIKVVLLSNHGSESQTRLAEIRVFGVPAGG